MTTPQEQSPPDFERGRLMPGSSTKITVLEAHMVSQEGKMLFIIVRFLQVRHQSRARGDSTSM